MTSRFRRTTTGLVLLALAWAPASIGDTPARVVQYANDALTVRLTKAPIVEVLEEIGRQTGAEIRGQVAEAREVSADFDAVPLPEALRRLLGAQNFALVYGDNGTLKVVKLLGESKDGVAIPARGAAKTSRWNTPEEILNYYLARPVTLALGSRLGRAVPAGTPTVRQVAEAGLGDGDASIRADAVRVLLQAAEAEPELRAALAEAVADVDDVSLNTMLRRTAGAHTEEVVRLIAAETTIVPLRIRANALLRAMPSQ